MLGKKTKRKKSTSSKFIGAIIFIFMLFVSVNVVIQLNTYIDLKAQEEKLEEKIREEQYKQEEYNNQMDYYNTDEYIEKIAREQLGLVMPDEIVFKIDKK